MNSFSTITVLALGLAVGACSSALAGTRSETMGAAAIQGATGQQPVSPAPSSPAGAGAGQAPAPAPTTNPAAPAPGQPAGTAPAGGGITPAAGVPLPDSYVIGPDDVLQILFWRDKDMSTEVAVRPDGKITLPLLNEVQATGLTPDQLRDRITAEASKLVEDPNVSVIVKAINSRRVYISGQVGKPGVYPLSGPTTVMQLIAMAGGLQEFADSKNIMIMRVENGNTVAFKFNYKDIVKGKNLKQNILLKLGDTIIVP
jgi:polysaccharide export outer membrane protein